MHTCDYANEERTIFKSATRLECMMQDYVKTVRPSHKVGWTRYPIEFGYFPCKNDIVSAAKLSAQARRSASTSPAPLAASRVSRRPHGCAAGTRFHARRHRPMLAERP